MRFASSILKTGVIAAALVLGTTVAKADTMNFSGSAQGGFNGASTGSSTTSITATGATGNTLTYYGSTFNGNTSYNPTLGINQVNFGGNGVNSTSNFNNFGSFQLANTVGNYNNVPFELFLTFTNPLGINGGQNSTFNATVFGSVSSDPNNAGGIQVSFMPASQSYSFANSTQTGTFTLNLNSVSVTPGYTASVTGYIQSSATSVAATPEPNSLMLLGTGFVSAAGMLMRRRKTMTA